MLALVSALSVATVFSAEWQSAQIPGAWEDKGPPVAANYDGVAWYRTWIKMPASAFSPHERNIFEESIAVMVSELADTHEIYVNGRRIGAGGSFPPTFQSGRAQIHRHKVPVGTLRKDEWNEIAVRVYNRSGPGGFLGDAPAITTYDMECIFEGKWEFLIGDEYRPGGALANRPASSSFSEFRPATRILGQAAGMGSGPTLPPNESFAQIKTADDIRAELLLSEPGVAQPNHLTFDARGRLWVSQYRQYPYPAGVKMVSRDRYYRSYYDRVPPAPPNHDRGLDRISIHEDTDGDGKYDKNTIFQDGLNMTTAALHGRGGVWVLNIPYLLFYPDRNFDDIPDGPPEVHLQGFGLEDSHAVANGLVWGADGWIYGGVGSSTTSRINRPRMDPPDTESVYFPGCFVWRYHPVTREFDIFSEGSSNLYGLELDAHGRLFSGHTATGAQTGDSRGWYYVQGGFYLMQGIVPSRFGPPRNPYAFGDLPKMGASNPVRRFSHFGAFADGTALPARYAGHWFALDPLHNEIIAAARQPQGSNFQTRDVDRPLWSGDPAFRPVYLVNAPDGSLILADLYEYYIAHGQHYQGQVSSNTGRIYRLRGTNLPLERDINLVSKSTAELIGLLSHSNKWHRQTAVRLLGERRDRAAVSKLEQLMRDNRGMAALHALWALHQMDALSDHVLVEALRHSFSPLRMWAVRLLGDRYGINRGLGLRGITMPKSATPASETAMSSLLALAENEPNAEVRSQLASTARRLVPGQASQLFAKLVGRDEDLTDPFIPLLNWWILEAHVAASLPDMIAPFRAPAFWDRPIVQQHILPRLMRRYAVEGRRQDLLVAAELLRMAPSPRHAAFLIKGFEEAFRGRPMVGLPDELLQAMAATGQAPLVLRVRQGEPPAIAEAMAILRNPSAAGAERVMYARIFGEVKSPGALAPLMAVVTSKSPAELQKAAMASLMAYDVPDIGPWAADLLPKTSGEVRTATLGLLASRPQWSRHLLVAIERGKIARTEIPTDIVARLRSHTGTEISDQVRKLFPPVAATSSNFSQRIAEVEAVLKRGTGNPYAGEELYMQRCASCHKLNFKGGNVGPDLTNYQRDNLGTMLPSIINPNSEIREGFQYYLVKTKDGRSLSGFMVEGDNQVVVLRGIEGTDVTLREAEIQEMQPLGRSLMPESLLDGLSDQQLRDFFAFLRIAQPLTR